jgi:hypothetical protein
LNIVTGATTASQPADWNTAPWINPFFGGVDLGNDDLIRVRITSPDQLLNLAAGSVIDATGSYTVGESGSSTHFGPASNQFQASTPGYIGFEFETTVGGPTYFGWARLTVNNTGAGTIHEWAYEGIAGNAITVGVIPEPGISGLLLLGLGCAFRRRR